MFTRSLSTLKRGVFANNTYRLFSESLPEKRSNENTVIVEKVGEVTTIGLNRPEKKNCINASTAKLLEKSIESFEEDDTSCVGIIYGIGGNFCSGEDLEEISNLGDDYFETCGSTTLGFPRRLITKPLIAAISGYAVAGGLEIALMCDLRIIEETAVLGFYNRRFGFPCSNGGTVRLPALVGLSRALDLILTGRSLTAQDAFQWGLANRLVACGTALGQALQVARSLVKFPQKCLLHDRKALYESTFNSSLENLLRNEKENASKILNQESIDGAKKFIESGIGRHGKSYYLKEKNIPDWEKE